MLVAVEVGDAINAIAKAIAWETLTPKGRAECIWPDDWSPGDVAMFRAQAYAALGAYTQQASINEQNVRDLSALVRKLAERLHRAKPDSVWPDRAWDFLRRKGLQGSIFRG